MSKPFSLILAALVVCMIAPASVAASKKPVQRQSLGKGQWVKCTTLKKFGPIYLKMGPDGHYLCWSGKRPR
jgi:hypothetical protein